MQMLVACCHRSDRQAKVSVWVDRIPLAGFRGRAPGIYGDNDRALRKSFPSPPSLRSYPSLTARTYGAVHDTVRNCDSTYGPYTFTVWIAASSLSVSIYRWLYTYFYDSMKPSINPVVKVRGPREAQPPSPCNSMSPPP